MHKTLLLTILFIPLDSFDYFFSTDSQSEISIDEIDRTNIAWITDRSIRFRNPFGAVNVSEADINGTVRPPNWPKDLSKIDGGLQNESFIVWFRVSAFPLFRKLYGRAVIDGGEPGRTELPAGNYSLNITYSIHFYPSLSFSLSLSLPPPPPPPPLSLSLSLSLSLVYATYTHNMYNIQHYSICTCTVVGE